MTHPGPSPQSPGGPGQHPPTQPYPTAGSPTPPPAGGGNNRLMIILIAAVLVLAIVVGLGFFLTRAPAAPTPATVVPAAAPTAIAPTSAAPPPTAAPVATSDIRLDPVNTLGVDPFSSPIGTDVADAPAANPPIGTLVNGGLPGLYGGTNETRCDKNALVSFLQADPRKIAAFGSVLGVPATDVPAYVNGLAEAVLRSDTAVTSHGYRNGEAIRTPVVLQAGTRVLVDDRGVPVVRCQSGSPLAPSPAPANPNYVGQRWATFNPAAVTTIQPAPQPLTGVQLTNVYNGQVYSVPVQARALASSSNYEVTGGAAKLSCNAINQTPGYVQGSFQVTNLSARTVAVEQYDPFSGSTNRAILPPNATSPFDTWLGTVFVVRDAQQPTSCLEVISGPGAATIR